MSIIDIVIPLFLIAIIIKQLRYINRLIIPTRKSYIEIIIVLFGVIIFISMYKYKEIILWNEVEKVMIICSKDIKIKVSDGFMQQTFHFKKSDYDKVSTILKEKLPIRSQLQTICNK